MPATQIPPAFKAGAVGTIYRVSVVGSSPFGDHVNTFHVRQQTPNPAGGDAFQEIKDLWDANVKGSYLALFDTAFSVRSLRVQQVDGNIKGLPSQAFVLTGSGTRVEATERLPGQLAALIDYQSGFSGRRGRARQFIGVLHEGDQNQGVVSSALVTLLNTYGGTLLNTYGISSTSYPLVGYIQVTNEVVDIKTATAKTAVYTQRRRRLTVGS